jgi:transposase
VEIVRADLRARPRRAGARDLVLSELFPGHSEGRHVIGLDQRGAIVLRQKWSRGQVEARLANMPPCLIGMEACVGAHHLRRKLQSLDHDARLMPARCVPAYLKGHKNDFRDGEAIAEAVQRPTMKFVATKTAEQLDLQALHWVCTRLIGRRRYRRPDSCCWTAGLRCGRDRASCAPKLPRILATRCDVLSPRMVHVIEELAGEWHRLDERIKSVSSEIEAIGRSGPSMRPVDDRAWHRSDHIERDGGRNRQWRGSHEAWLIYVKKLQARC